MNYLQGIASTLLLAALSFCSTSAAAQAAQGDVQTKKDVEYAVHDGVSLKGDLYVPAIGGMHPAMLFIHGGGFRGGSKAGYGNTWGPYLAARGIVVFAIDYRLSTATQTTWPQALLDCKAAVQYLRGDASELGVDPDRIGVGGDSAGASLVALLAITQDAPAFANRYVKDRYAPVSTRVKVAMPIYGVYDMLAWQRHTSQQNNGNGARPLEQFFGGPPEKVPGAFFEASAISYMREAATSLGAVATSNPGTKIPWFLAWGMVDNVVPPAGQSVPFVQALKDAGVKVAAIPVPNVDHFWFTSSAITGKKGEPHCQEQAAGKFNCDGATPNDFIAEQLLEFLKSNL